MNRLPEIGNERHKSHLLGELDLSFLRDLTTWLTEPVLHFEVRGNLGLISLDPLPHPENESLPLLATDHRLHRTRDFSGFRGVNTLTCDLVGRHTIQLEDWEQVSGCLVTPAATHAAAAKSSTSGTVRSAWIGSGSPALASTAMGHPPPSV